MLEAATSAGCSWLHSGSGRAHFIGGCLPSIRARSFGREARHHDTIETSDDPCGRHRNSLGPEARNLIVATFVPSYRPTLGHDAVPRHPIAIDVIEGGENVGDMTGNDRKPRADQRVRRDPSIRQ